MEKFGDPHFQIVSFLHFVSCIWSKGIYLKREIIIIKVQQENNMSTVSRIVFESEWCRNTIHYWGFPILNEKIHLIQLIKQNKKKSSMSFESTTYQATCHDHYTKKQTSSGRHKSFQ